MTIIATTQREHMHGPMSYHIIAPADALEEQVYALMLRGLQVTARISTKDGQGPTWPVYLHYTGEPYTGRWSIQMDGECAPMDNETLAMFAEPGAVAEGVTPIITGTFEVLQHAEGGGISLELTVDHIPDGYEIPTGGLTDVAAYGQIVIYRTVTDTET